MAGVLVRDILRAMGMLRREPAAQAAAERRARALRGAPPGCDPWAWLASQGDETAREVVALRSAQHVQQDGEPRLDGEVPSVGGGDP